MRSTRTIRCACWNCGFEFDAASDVAGKKRPYPGAVSVCIECGAPGFFQDDLSVRKPTTEEMFQLLRSRRVLSYMTAVAKIHEGRSFADSSGNGFWVESYRPEKHSCCCGDPQCTELRDRLASWGIPLSEVSMAVIGVTIEDGETK